MKQLAGALVPHPLLVRRAAFCFLALGIGAGSLSSIAGTSGHGDREGPSLLAVEGYGHRLPRGAPRPLISIGCRANGLIPIVVRGSNISSQKSAPLSHEPREARALDLACGLDHV